MGFLTKFKIPPATVRWPSMAPPASKKTYCTRTKIQYSNSRPRGTITRKIEPTRIMHTHHIMRNTSLLQYILISSLIILNVNSLSVGLFQRRRQNSPQQQHDLLFDPTLTISQLNQLVSDQLIDQAIDSVSGPPTPDQTVIRQYRPQRTWLWRRWDGTLVRQSLFVTAVNMLASMGLIVMLRIITKGSWPLGIQPDISNPIIARLAVSERVWQYQMTLTTFVLTFFVGEAFMFWKNSLWSARCVQGKLLDINLLLTTHAARDENGRFQPQATRFLQSMSQLSRVFHVLFWASISRRYRVLLTHRGRERLVQRGVLTREQHETLMKQDLPVQFWSDACLEWMVIRWRRGLSDGSIEPSDGLNLVLLNKACELRGESATIGAKIAGRMPLAYTHFVQILTDSFLLCAPLALYAQLGAFSVLSVGLLTLFYSGFLDLGKVLLDPLNNEPFCENSIYMNQSVLLKESNLGSTQWRRAAEYLPFYR